MRKKRKVINSERLNMRVSAKAIKTIKLRAEGHGISQSKFVSIATAIVSDDDILAYLLAKVAEKHDVDTTK